MEYSRLLAIISNDWGDGIHLDYHFSLWIDMNTTFLNHTFSHNEEAR